MNCPQCDHPTRPMHMKAGDAPGTRQRCGDGLCKNCYYHNRKNDPVLTPEQLTSALNALNGWLQARNNRLTRSKGASQWQQTETASTTRKSAPGQHRSGTAQPTVTPGVAARRGGTTRVTRSRPTRNARSTEIELERL